MLTAILIWLVAVEGWADTSARMVTGGSACRDLSCCLDRRAWSSIWRQLVVLKEVVYDLATFFGEGNAWRLVKPELFRWLSLGSGRQGNTGKKSRRCYVRGTFTTPDIFAGQCDRHRLGTKRNGRTRRASKVLGRPVECGGATQNGNILPNFTHGKTTGSVSTRCENLWVLERWYNNFNRALPPIFYSSTSELSYVQKKIKLSWGYPCFLF